MTRYLLDPQGGEGNGAPAPQADLATMLKALIAEKGDDAKAVAKELLAKNRELEADNRNYRRKIKDLKAGAPAEGSLVLSKDDAQLWAKYRDLGDPEEVKASLDAGTDAIREREKADRVGNLKKAASAAGYGPDVFADLAESKGLAVEVNEETRDGKAVVDAFVTGEGGSRTPLKEFVETHLSSYLPALTQGKEPPPKDRDRSRDATPPRAGTSPFVLRPGRDEEDPTERGLVNRAAYAT